MNFKTTETSILVFGIYMIFIPGLGLILIPNLLFDLFHISYGQELWTARLVGLLALLLGVYYYLISKHKIHILYKTTAMLRYIAATFMVGLWALQQVEISILLFALVDALAASWTLLTLNKANLSQNG